MHGQPFRATKEHVNSLAAQNSFFALRQKDFYFTLSFQPVSVTHPSPGQSLISEPLVLPNHMTNSLNWEYVFCINNTSNLLMPAVKGICSC